MKLINGFNYLFFFDLKYVWQNMFSPTLDNDVRILHTLINQPALYSVIQLNTALVELHSQCSQYQYRLLQYKNEPHERCESFLHDHLESLTAHHKDGRN